MIDTDKDEGLTADEWKDVVNGYHNLLAEVKRLREQNKLMVDYFRFMRDGGFTDADWRTVNEWIGDEEE
tara:strand:- start:229 stop:435 length:207 start_codon:yes stop_codon:yes gene_type:complete